MAEENRRTVPRRQLQRDPAFDDLSPDVGELDESAVMEMANEDADHALEMLADMRGATDRQLAAMAARIAGRLVLDIARSGPSRARGVGTMVSSPADRADGDLDVEGSLDALLTAKAGRHALDPSELRVRHWTQPATAVALVIDRSGSMNGRRLATAAVAAAACAHRAPVDWSVVAFADRILALKSQGDHRSCPAVIDDLLRLRGIGTTDLAGGLLAAARQLQRSRAKRRVTVLLSDCRPTAGVDPVSIARGLDELCIIAPADDADDAKDFARSVGAAFAVIDGPSDLPAVLQRLL